MHVRKGLRKGNCDRLTEREWGRKGSKLAFINAYCQEKSQSKIKMAARVEVRVLFVGEVLIAVKLALMASRYALVH
jgi:hypothetical protein